MFVSNSILHMQCQGILRHSVRENRCLRQKRLIFAAGSGKCNLVSGNRIGFEKPERQKNISATEADWDYDNGKKAFRLKIVVERFY